MGADSDATPDVTGADWETTPEGTTAEPMIPVEDATVGADSETTPEGMAADEATIPEAAEGIAIDATELTADDAFTPDDTAAGAAVTRRGSNSTRDINEDIDWAISMDRVYVGR